MSKEFVYYILGGISSVSARPVAAGMMLKQRETTLVATGVTSRYKTVLPLSQGQIQSITPTYSPETWLGEGRKDAASAVVGAGRKR